MTVAAFDPAVSMPGYNLYSSRNLASAHLIDAGGRVVHQWEDNVRHLAAA